VYVVELSPDVLNEPRFMKANPTYRLGKPCVYVGMTGLTPDERFDKHKAGIKSNKYARLYGLRLMPKLWSQPQLQHNTSCARRQMIHRRQVPDPLGQPASPNGPFLACAVKRRRFPVGESPTRQPAPAGSTRSDYGGNEMVEAFG
jgi:hypothetical protein